MKIDPAVAIQEKVGGIQATVSVAVTKKAFEQAYQSVKQGGTLVVVGLVQDELPIPIFDTVLNGVTVRGSIVGKREDMLRSTRFCRAWKSTFPN